MKDFIILAGFCGLVLFGINRCTESDWYKRGEAEKALQEQRERTPHVIREVDSCKVYAFKVDDHYHYFTRCPNSTVSTDRQYDVQCGKNCHRTKTETIVTESH